jgi:hypothetical protein
MLSQDNIFYSKVKKDLFFRDNFSVTCADQMLLFYTQQILRSDLEQYFLKGTKISETCRKNPDFFLKKLGKVSVFLKNPPHASVISSLNIVIFQPKKSAIYIGNRLVSFNIGKYFIHVEYLIVHI